MMKTGYRGQGTGARKRAEAGVQGPVASEARTAFRRFSIVSIRTQNPGPRTLVRTQDPGPRTLTRLLYLLTCIAVTLFHAVPASADVLEMLKKTYSEVQTVEARFDQKITIATLKRERESKGEFYYKRSRGFLWKYSEPAPKIFLYDGKAMWQADEDKPFVVKERVDKARIEGSFFDLVDDVSKLDQLFNVREAAKEKEGSVLLLMPKKEGMLQSARMWLDNQYLVRRIEITEATGNVNALSFSAIKVNKGLSDSLFLFNPGKKEIVER
ncbi:MAG: lolA [Deltaproteobacteria bacterium]|nr:lolA [Deltaproteobacteria bacterium]